MRPSSSHLTPSKESGFSVVSRPRLCDGVAAQIRTFIAEGKLAPGDKLPAERELVQRFQVSRSSVREAIRTLELMGLVRSRQGGGTVIREISADTLTVPLSSVVLHKRELVAELLEARYMLEPPIAARAALRATDDQIEELERVLAAQREKMRRHEPTSDEDSEFHYRIAVAARNAVVRKVVDLLRDLLRESRSRSPHVEGRMERSYAGHRRILRCIKRHDPEAAEKAMRLHLRGIEALVLKSL